MNLLPMAGTAATAGAALCAVLGLIWLAQRVARYRGIARQPGAAPDLAVAARLPLDSRRRLLLVACEGRRVLLLTGGPSDLVVGWLPPGPEGAP